MANLNRTPGMYIYELIAFQLYRTPSQDGSTVLHLVHHAKFDDHMFATLVESTFEEAERNIRRRWALDAPQEILWESLIYDVCDLLVLHHGFTRLQPTSSYELDFDESFGKTEDAHGPYCATCGASVGFEVPCAIVPPFYDASSFRCPACVTPEEQRLIDESTAAYKAGCISWDAIRAELTPEQFARFERWMDGQTYSVEYGVYRSDYERFKAGLPVID